jgi:hypothetical protein
MNPSFSFVRMLKSATFWNIALIFITAGLNSLIGIVPPQVESVIQVLLGASAYWQHSHPAVK